MSASANEHASHVDYTPLKPIVRSAEETEALDACLWFDIDNCLYSKSRGIAPLMGQKIHEYFIKLGFSEQEAWDIHQLYYKEYGLAIRGLQVNRPDFDAEDFDRNCDGALPLEELLSEDMPLQQLLRDIDRSRVKVMALTNAHKPHALRVLGILGVTDQFEGVVSCQYRTTAFPAKPDPEYYQEAIKICGLSDPAKQYFVDDSLLNVKGSQRQGWHSWLFDEDGGYKGKVQEGDVEGTISSTQELRQVWKQFFKV